MSNVLEVVGLTLVLAAVVCLTVVAWSFVWQAGLSVAAVAAGVLGGVLVVAGNRRSGP